MNLNNQVPVYSVPMLGWLHESNLELIHNGTTLWDVCS